MLLAAVHCQPGDGRHLIRAALDPAHQLPLGYHQGRLMNRMLLAVDLLGLLFQGGQHAVEAMAHE
ncbi:protein of unknown function [Cyanobium sp. NIES-981]|nr:protein of unknown function [Cyanobium sp. NIES-981]